MSDPMTKISLRQAATESGAHVSTVLRWVHRGVNGVRLEASRQGGRWFTTRSALARFSATLTAERVPPGPAPDATRTRPGHGETRVG
jgi:hypothetical protein